MKLKRRARVNNYNGTQVIKATTPGNNTNNNS